MSNPEDNQTDVELLAAQWVVRAQDGGHGTSLRDEDILDLTRWLEASPEHALAFENALLTWGQADDLRACEDTSASMSAESVVVPMQAWRERMAERRPVWRSPAVVAALAACLAAAVIVPMITLSSAPMKIYETHKGQRQTIALADGSTLMLNTGTRVSVRLSGHARKLVLERGEVALKVVHDTARPLTLTAGDMQITDIGTEFNVRRDDGTVAVSVREGKVELTSGGGQPLTLGRGDVGVHREGAAAATLDHADPDEAFAWQSAHAIYRDQPLSAVVKDLNRYFDTPIVVDAEAGKLHLNAILTLDSEPLVVRRLQDFLPVQAKTTDGGIYLSLGAAHRGKL